MKKIIKQVRILIAMPILALGHWIDARDMYDLRAEFDRLNPSPDKASAPLHN